jgi:virulence factor Mce-like protein
MQRNASSNALANPMLVGAITCLVGLVAVVLSYNANNGLPFVPTYNVKAIVPDAAELTPGNEVRIGGKRVGSIAAITAQRTPAGADAALDLRLDKGVQPLPVDSVVTVRPRSPLGLKYLELRPGRSKRGVPADGTLPRTQARPVVELDEALNTFDHKTRSGLQGVLLEAGDGLAGRGADLNEAIDAAGPLVVHLRNVAANFASPRTDLHGLIAGLQATTAAVDPEAGTLVDLFDAGARTLDAVDQAGDAVGQSIDAFPATEATGTQALRRIDPVVASAVSLTQEIAPGVRVLQPATRELARTVEVGTPVLDNAVDLADRLGDALSALRDLVRDPATSGSILKLTAVVSSLEPTLRYLNPMQTVCNYMGLWTRNAPSTVSEGDANGTWFRFLPVFQLDEGLQRGEPAPDLHANPYPQTGQDGECEQGNDTYVPGQHIGNAPGRQPAATEDTAPPPGVGP